MLKFGQFILRNFLNIIVLLSTWTISEWYFDVNFWISSLLAISSYFPSNYIIKNIQQFRYLKRVGLTRSEFKHIQTQLDEAQSELRNLNRYYTKVRSISTFKQLFEMNRLAKRIVNIVNKNPKKFYHAEQFFYAHLHSASELTEKYALLSSQPIKSSDVHLALQETRETLEDLNNIMQEDLHSVLATDIEELKMELDFAQLSTTQKQTSATLRGDSK
ncbi:5-bromo-4-chloroindolyl phosphate hydrolysis family protein [Rummeliibacillus pycnus]|uniref:5-bromo-4-chloroindolyl phosphate hydrolysis family protein n=1 Tax=Rummeliibacillus pycnus TaxID=101070 RepID=UPI0037C854F9